ncbi:acylneuraminate cytidylyltransferase family protein [Andreprevotia chitinilytica]|uniref:acylneuraminate cytidylyltransferase family protein n=1 Tax=Andreprevotia chitinilytica TaxID=396808 RepID=UPI00054DD62B|nr:acylneuraminate cytidylyltransferase family protein [Andreprevotia chitinilytica]
MKWIAIIPARGGSKRLPRKNILDFQGRPMLAYTVAAALETGLFEQVIVSTEDDEIAAVAHAAGAQVDRRSPDLATDKSTVAEVCAELLQREAHAGRHYDGLCCCYATAPLRTAADIAATVGLIQPGQCEFAVAVTTFSHYPHQALRQDAQGGLAPMWPEAAGLRSEVIGTLLAGNGSTYAVTVEAFLRDRDFYGPGMRGYRMPFHRSIDIDTREDFELALAVANHAGFRA